MRYGHLLSPPGPRHWRRQLTRPPGRTSKRRRRRAVANRSARSSNACGRQGTPNLGSNQVVRFHRQHLLVSLPWAPLPSLPGYASLLWPEFDARKPFRTAQSSGSFALLLKLGAVGLKRRTDPVRIHGWIPHCETDSTQVINPLQRRPTSLRCRRIRIDRDAVTIVVETMTPPGFCPICRHPSDRIHSRYTRACWGTFPRWGDSSAGAWRPGSFSVIHRLVRDASSRSAWLGSPTSSAEDRSS